MSKKVNSCSKIVMYGEKHWRSECSHSILPTANDLMISKRPRSQKSIHSQSLEIGSYRLIEMCETSEKSDTMLHNIGIRKLGEVVKRKIRHRKYISEDVREEKCKTWTGLNWFSIMISGFGISRTQSLGSSTWLVNKISGYQSCQLVDFYRLFQDHRCPNH